VKDKTNTLFAMSMNRLDTATAADQKAKDQMYEGIGSMFNPLG